MHLLSSFSPSFYLFLITNWFRDWNPSSCEHWNACSAFLTEIGMGFYQTTNLMHSRSQDGKRIRTHTLPEHKHLRAATTRHPLWARSCPSSQLCKILLNLRRKLVSRSSWSLRKFRASRNFCASGISVSLTRDKRTITCMSRAANACRGMKRKKASRFRVSFISIKYLLFAQGT